MSGKDSEAAAGHLVFEFRFDEPPEKLWRALSMPGLREHLAEFVEARAPAGGLQTPCLLIRDIPEGEAVEAARRADVDLLGLTALHASSRRQAGFLMGFAAHTPHELEIAVKKLAQALRALSN